MSDSLRCYTDFAFTDW